MSEKLNQIARDRIRIARLYIDYCMRHYGGKWSDVVVTKKKIVRVDITEKSICFILIKFIENLSCSEHGLVEGRGRVVNLYSQMLNKDAGKLTPLGATVMIETMLAAVIDAIENPLNNELQVVNHD